MKKALKNKEIRRLLQEINKFNGFLKKDKYEIDDDILIINNEPLFFYYENKLIPSLHLLLKTNTLKKVIVDMGAVKFVVKGADIMRPGIVKIDEGIEKDEIISIIDENYGKPVALGRALLSGKEMQEATSGKVVQNIHYVGDRFWNYH